MRADATFTVKAFTPTELVAEPAVATGTPAGVATTEKAFEGHADGTHRVWFEYKIK